MRHACIALFVPVLCLSLVSLPAGQDDRPPAPEEPETPSSPRASNRDLLVRMQGCWRLTDAVIRDLDEEGRVDLGVLLVSEEFMSIEMHILYEERSEVVDEILQTGTYRMRFTHEGFLDTTSLIGSLGEEEEFQFVPPGEGGSYRVEFASDQLVITARHDGSRYTFKNIPPSPDYAGDFFGRRSAGQPESDDGRR